MWWKQSKTFFFRWPRQFVLRKNSYQNTKQNMIRPENGPGGGDTLLNTKQSKQIEFFKLNRIQSTNYNYNTTHTYTHAHKNSCKINQRNDRQILFYFVGIYFYLQQENSIVKTSRKKVWKIWYEKKRNEKWQRLNAHTALFLELLHF